MTSDCTLSEKFTVAVYNRFGSPCAELEEPSISTIYDNLVAANEGAALEMLPKKSKQMYNIAASDKVVEARTALKDASMKILLTLPEPRKRYLESTKEALDQGYTEALEPCIQNLTSSIMNVNTLLLGESSGK